MLKCSVPFFKLAASLSVADPRYSRLSTGGGFSYLTEHFGSCAAVVLLGCKMLERAELVSCLTIPTGYWLSRNIRCKASIPSVKAAHVLVVLKIL